MVALSIFYYIYKEKLTEKMKIPFSLFTTVRRVNTHSNNTHKKIFQILIKKIPILTIRMPNKPS